MSHSEELLTFDLQSRTTMTVALIVFTCVFASLESVFVCAFAMAGIWGGRMDLRRKIKKLGE